MRLQLDSSISRPPEIQTGSTGGGSSASRVSDSGGSRDSISISGTTAGLNRLATDRAERIQQLSAAVKSGSYNVSSAAIGSAILSSAGA